MRQNLRPTFSLSPDGRWVVSNGGERGVRLFDWHANQMRYIPLPTGFHNPGWPTYSTDGAKIAVVAELASKAREQVVPETKLGIIDATTEETISYPNSDRLFNPVFRPDGKAVMYLGGSLTVKRPFLFDLRTQTSRELLSKNDGFYEILSPSFVSDDTVLFVGTGPANPDLKAAVQRLGYSPVSEPVPYLLKIRSKPEMAYLDLLGRYWTASKQ